jgi:glycosyltransferase involved in cell wall biosynthesis
MERPLIATDVPGCTEAIDEGLNGFLCAPRDVASLERAMLRLIDVPPEQREAMGRHSRRKMEREFSEDVVVNSYLHAVSSLSPHA